MTEMPKLLQWARNRIPVVNKSVSQLHRITWKSKDFCLLTRPPRDITQILGTWIYKLHYSHYSDPPFTSYKLGGHMSHKHSEVWIGLTRSNKTHCGKYLDWAMLCWDLSKPNLFILGTEGQLKFGPTATDVCNAVFEDAFALLECLQGSPNTGSKQQSLKKSNLREIWDFDWPILKYIKNPLKAFEGLVWYCCSTDGCPWCSVRRGHIGRIWHQKGDEIGFIGWIWAKFGTRLGVQPGLGWLGMTADLIEN